MALMTAHTTDLYLVTVPDWDWCSGSTPDGATILKMFLGLNWFRQGYEII